jgi:hypothetical protein
MEFDYSLEEWRGILFTYVFSKVLSVPEIGISSIYLPMSNEFKRFRRKWLWPNLRKSSRIFL